MLRISFLGQLLQMRQDIIRGSLRSLPSFSQILLRYKAQSEREHVATNMWVIWGAVGITSASDA